jgi:ABC-type Na+ efflux pump permease subunit
MAQSPIAHQKSRIALFWTLWRKDMNVAVRTPYTLITLAIPIFLSLLFIFLFPNLPAPGRLQIAMYDPGQSQLAALLAAQPHLEMISVSGPDSLVQSVTEGFTAGLAIPDDFDTAVQNDQRPSLTVYLNGRGNQRAATATFQRLLSEQIWQMRYGQPPTPIEWQKVSLSQSPAENLSVSDYLLILLLLLALVMTGATITSTAIVEEKGQTLYPLLNSPVAAADVIASKVLTGLFFTLLAGTAILLLNQGWQGDWPRTAAALLLGAIFTVGVGLLLGLVSATRGECNTWTGVISLVLCAPVWFTVTPLQQLPTLLRLAVQVIPTHYLILALTHTLQGLSTGLNLVFLGGAAVLVYAAATRHLLRHPL